MNALQTKRLVLPHLKGDVTLNFILDETKNLHWEGHRRTDLVRFGRLPGGSYLWPWKMLLRDLNAISRIWLTVATALASNNKLNKPWMLII
jgi:hypothetical protein